jgi:hypothetical protein
MSSSFHRKPNSSGLVPGLSTGDYSLTGIERDSTQKDGGGRIVCICLPRDNCAKETVDEMI